MTTKHKILKTDLILQSLAIAGIGVAFFINMMTNESFAETFFGIMVLVLASVQVLGALIIGGLYDDKRRKNYLRVLFWMHGVGTLMMAIVANLNIEALLYINIFIFVIDWLISPFFLAIWSWSNSFKSFQEYEAELYSEYV